jgi:histidinol-phosphate aminotransferase
VAALAEELTAFVGLPEGCRLMLGNGSDELIDLLAVACDKPGAPPSWRRCRAS